MRKDNGFDCIYFSGMHFPGLLGSTGYRLRLHVLQWIILSVWQDNDFDCIYCSEMHFPGLTRKPQPTCYPAHFPCGVPLAFLNKGG